MKVDMRALREALATNSIVPCFQPLADLRTGELASFELLARWQHPELGLILPENFISLAEEHGRIDELMEQVLSKAFAAVAALPEQVGLAVNVSPVQLRDTSLPRKICEVADAAGFSLDRLTVEITESALVDNLDRAQTIAQALKAMGCKLALDDFGTGFSSLAHLRALPFDELKIDRQFVRDMTEQRESRKIVAAVIGLGHSLGLKTVAEGVETVEQAAMLLRLGCELGQGWYYGRPVPMGEIHRFLGTHLDGAAAVPMSPKDMTLLSLQALPTQRLAQMQAIYDGAPVGLCYLDRNLRYVSMNQKLAEMNCTTVERCLGRHVRDVVGELWEQIEPFLGRALEGERIDGLEITRKSVCAGKPDSTNLLTYQPAFDEDGEVVGVSVVAMDVTELKLVQQQLQEADRLWHLADRKGHTPWVMDAKGNGVLARLGARSGSQTNVRSRSLGWLERVHPEDLDGMMEVIEEAMEHGRPIDVRYRMRDERQEWVWMRSRGVPRLGSSGEIVRWYGTVEELDRQLVPMAV